MIFDCKALSQKTILERVRTLDFRTLWFFEQKEKDQRLTKTTFKVWFFDIFWFSQVTRLAPRSTGEVLLGALWPFRHNRARRARDHRPTVQHGLVTGGTEVKKYSSRHRPELRTRRSKEKPQKMRKKSRKMVGQRHKASLVFFVALAQNPDSWGVSLADIWVTVLQWFPPNGMHRTWMLNCLNPNGPKNRLASPTM